MRIEITDTDCCRSHVIDSQNLGTIGRWFTEKAKLLMSADTRTNHPVRMDIWPSTHEETELIPLAHQRVEFDQDGLLDFAKRILAVSQELADREEVSTG